MKVVFLPHCILNYGVKNGSAGLVTDLLTTFSKHRVGIVQMPCPKFNFDPTLRREQYSKKIIDRNGYRNFCRGISKNILDQAENYLKNNHDVLGIVGLEFSPNCGITFVRNRNKNVMGRGILTEEIKKEMNKRELQIPFFAANMNNLLPLVEKLNSLLKYS